MPLLIFTERGVLMNPPPRKLRLAVLVSGGGTNLQSLLDRSAAGKLHAEVGVVVSDREDAYGLVRAERAGIPHHTVDYKACLESMRELDPSTMSLPVDLTELDSRQRILKDDDPARRLSRLAGLVLAEKNLLEILDGYQPDYICLAGFMRLLSPYFLSHYSGEDAWRVLNIHPALLPAFPGEHGYEETFAYGVKWGGVTVHFVDEGEDTGPIIGQGVYPLWGEDDLDTVRARGLRLEYEIYAQCINWLAFRQVEMQRGADGRVRTVIRDPAYADILRSWLQKSFS
jgi:phosphoribosylglycinamide formyltransferase-1